MSLYELSIPNEFFAHDYTITHIGQLPMIFDITDGVDVPIKKEKNGYNYVSLKVKHIEYEELCDDFSKKKVSIRSKKFRLHRLLALQFIQKTKDDIFYNRDRVVIIDGNKDNLSLSNLIWMNSYESTAISIYRNKGLDSMIKYYLDNNDLMDMNNMIHILFDTKIIKNRLFKKRYILKETQRVLQNYLDNN